MMAAGNPNWWSMSDMHPQPPSQQLSSSTYLSPSSHLQYLFGSSPLMSSTSLDDHRHDQHFPRSWSQLLMCGLPSDHQDRLGSSQCQYNWFQNGEDDHQVLNQSSRVSITDVKPEVAQSSQLYGRVNEEYQGAYNSRPNFRPQVNLVSSPTSCVTTLSSNNNLLTFSSSKAERKTQQHSDQSTEGNSSSTGGVAKKPRVQQSSTQPSLKVRKEKLGDRITALHQLVSPFGKTDTASVLSEAIGYIRFLVSQIEALSSPYLGNVSKSMGHQHSIQESNCLFPEELTQDGQDYLRDLRSRGLCLVPISYTQHVGSDNGADYWAPAFGGGGF